MTCRCRRWLSIVCFPEQMELRLRRQLLPEFISKQNDELVGLFRKQSDDLADCQLSADLGVWCAR